MLMTLITLKSLFILKHVHTLSKRFFFFFFFCFTKVRSKNYLRVFLLLPVVCWDISIGAVVFGLASHREVLGDERLHEAVHLAPLPRVHFIARAAGRATVPRRWAHHCSDSSLKKRRKRRTHMKVHRSVWVGGKRTWTSWVVTYAIRWPSCIPVCEVVAAHLPPSMSISENSLVCSTWLVVWST